MPGGGLSNQIDEVVLVAGQSSSFSLNSDLHHCEANEENPHSEHPNMYRPDCVLSINVKPSLI